MTYKRGLQVVLLRLPQVHIVIVRSLCAESQLEASDWMHQTRLPEFGPRSDCYGTIGPGYHMEILDYIRTL